MWSEVSSATRILSRTRPFAVVAVVTVAIGVAAVTTVFAVLNAVMLRPLSFSDPSTLVAIGLRGSGAGIGARGIPETLVERWLTEAHTLSSIAAYSSAPAVLQTNSNEQHQVFAAWISQSFFGVLGATPIRAGREFQRQDFISAANPGIVLSAEVWGRAFGGQRWSPGETVRLAGRQYEVLGILESGFRFPEVPAADVLLALPTQQSSAGVRAVNVIARLAASATLSDARRELSRVLGVGRMESGAMQGLTPIEAVDVMPLQHRLIGPRYDALGLAMLSGAFMLLLACVNTASLLLARYTSQERDLTLRIAIGATPGHLARAVFAESGVLAVVGGIVGIAFSLAILAGLQPGLERHFPWAPRVTLDWRTLGVALFAVILAAMLPAGAVALRIVRRTRATAGSTATGRTAGPWVRRLIIAGQTAVACTLIVTALLLLTSFRNLTARGLGFDADGVQTFKVPATAVSADATRRAERLESFLESLRSMAGVRAAGASTSLPLSGHSFGFVIAFADSPPPSTDTIETAVELVSPGYFEALGVPILRGRGFNVDDRATTTAVAVVNEAFVRVNGSGSDVVGRRIALGSDPTYADIEIVGIVRNFRDGLPSEEPRPQVYRPFTQSAPQIGWHTALMAVRAESFGHLNLEGIRRAATNTLTAPVIYDYQSMDARLSTIIAPQRERAWIFGLFAAIAVILAAVGIYGLLSFMIQQDMRQFGIKMALGSSRVRLSLGVLRVGVSPAFLGVLIGCSVSVFLSRLLTSFVYGVTATEPLIYLLSGAVIVSVATVAALGACYRLNRANALDVLKAQ
jgi:putative ABC transport system permease protein